MREGGVVRGAGRRAVTAALAVAAMLTAPGFAHAGEGLMLSWFDCRPSASAALDAGFGCDTNDPSFELFCAFRPPFDTGPTVIGIGVILDVQSAAATLPDWWHMEAAGGCRYGELTASADFGAYGDCADPWPGAVAAEVQGFTVGMPRNQPNQIRILAAAGVPPDSARALFASTTYYGLRLRLGTRFTTEPGICAGCQPQACLVLNGIVLFRLPGSPGGDVTIVTPEGGDGNRVTWMGTGVDCASVPVPRVTWGRIKSLYR